MSKISNGLEHVIDGVQMHLLPEKAIWIPDHDALLLSDLHLGKVDHFRKHGLAVPQAVGKGDLDVLSSLLERFSIRRCYLLGDLFHSEYNAEWERFSEWASLQQAQLFLVEGNHDILPHSLYTESHLLVSPQVALGQLLLTHVPMDSVPEGGFNIAGHIHPGIRLSGKGRQTLRLPCYFKGKRQLILPAFGSFTGLHILTPDPQDEVFAIAEHRVIQVQ